MTKSSRSKFKKFNRRERAKDEIENVQARLAKLNKKLHISVKGGMSRVPPQDPETRFHFKQPEGAGGRLVLPKMKTNPYGKTDTEAPHPATVTFEKVAPEAPVAGKAFTVEDANRIEAAQALQQAAAEMLENPDWTNDEPIEFTIGCNDDEHLTTSFLLGKKGVAGGKKESAEAPKAAKLKSMETQKAATKGSAKMKSATPTKRLVSGTAKKK